jgi:hypothetical protein
MYTQEYKKHLEKMDLAKANFDKKPCRETATILSNLRQSKIQMYTNEELEKRKTMREKADEIFWKEMWELTSNLRYK